MPISGAHCDWNIYCKMISSKWLEILGVSKIGYFHIATSEVASLRHKYSVLYVEHKQYCVLAKYMEGPIEGINVHSM